MGSSRRQFLVSVAAAGAVALAGCSDAVARDDDGPGDDGDGGAGPPLADGDRHVAHESNYLRSQVRVGTSRDGIPPIDDPEFVAARDADLADDEVVFGLAVDGDARAYPQHVLVWHEIVNDAAGGLPVSVTYCPLTGTALAFERGETTFGVSGRLLNSNLVMYDRATDTWWPQMLATGLSGPLAGETLREVPVAWTTWGRWRETHPSSRLLTDRTGYVRDYGRDPYGAAYYERGSPYYPPLVSDGRYPPKEVFLGARGSDSAAAYRAATLRERRVATGTLDGEPVVAVHDPRLDTGYVYRNPEGVPVERDGDRVRTPGGSHAPDALPLERVASYEAMWFAWAGYFPGSDVRV